MANLFGTLSSLLNRLKEKPAGPATESPPLPAAPEATPPAEARPSESSLPSEAELRARNDGQLREELGGLPERTMIRLLQSLQDSELQLRIIRHGITDEATLKRIARSGFDKKLKRAAEKKLREPDPAQRQTETLSQLTQKLESFLGHPDWRKAPALLDSVLDPSLPADESPLFIRFQELRERLQREIEAFDRACAELSEISAAVHPDRSLGKAALARLQERWQDLQVRYAFPKDLPALAEYAYHLEARANPKILTPARAAKAEAAQAAREAARKEAEARERQQKEERQKRAETLDTLLGQAQAFQDQLGSRQTATELRKLQEAVTALRRWKKEFPQKLDETENLIRDLLAKNAETMKDASWDTWARTDRASRIQSELETLITALEAEPDPVAAARGAAGLGERLFEYAKEMRGMGSLERHKDHQIWEQFKTLSDRGFALCDRTRLQVLEQLKQTLAAHSSKPIESWLPSLASPRASIPLKASALTDEVSAQVEALRSLWRAIGGRQSEAIRESEALCTHLFEHYFRQRNLHLGNIKRNETRSIEQKRALLAEMKASCESKASLPSRARVAKSLEDRWKQARAPETPDTAALEAEFAGYRERVQAEIAEEAKKHAELVLNLKAQAESVLEKIQNKTAANLPQALKTVGELDATMQTSEKHLRQFDGLWTPTADRQAFEAARSAVKDVLQACRDGANREVAERVSERAKVVEEAENLALATEWESSRARFEELRATWKKVGTLGQKDDALFDLLFENVWQFYRRRDEGRSTTAASGAPARRELLFRLEALSRFRTEGPKAGAEATPPLPLPVPESERAKVPARMLEFGMQAKQIVSLDPTQGVLKETKKIMSQWAQLAVPADEDAQVLAEQWRFYLQRVRWLLGLSG